MKFDDGEFEALFNHEAETDLVHDYLSTACWHNNHDHCKCEAGMTGSKVPGKCKFCEAKCRCACHG